MMRRLLTMAVALFAAGGLMVAATATAFADPKPPPPGCTDIGHGQLQCVSSQTQNVTGTYQDSTNHDMTGFEMPIPASTPFDASPYTWGQVCDAYYGAPAGYYDNGFVESLGATVEDVTTNTITTTTVEKKNGTVISSSQSLSSGQPQIVSVTGDLSCVA